MLLQVPDGGLSTLIETFGALVVTKRIQSQTHSLVIVSRVQLEETERELASISTVDGAQSMS